MNNRVFIVLFMVGCIFINTVVGLLSNERSEEQAEENMKMQIIGDNLDNQKIHTYHKMELRIQSPMGINNPYNPEEIELTGVFSGPDGVKYQIPGFFYQPFSRRLYKGEETYISNGNPEWRVRFTPDKPGRWSYQLLFKYGDKIVSSTSKSFIAQPGISPGFVRIAPGNTGYFVFDNGGLFLPVGSNVAWYDQRGMAAYEKWFTEMAKNGANYARIWLASWGFAPEWKDTGLGNYQKRQLQAWQLDYLFELAEKQGIYIMLCLTNHGQFSENTNKEWENNPYNIENGGILKEPAEFLTDSQAKEYFKRKLRYIVARWGYSCNLFSWEWFNEVNLTTGLGDRALLVPWMEEMKTYLETIDPYHRLVGNSYSSSFRGDEAEWRTAAVDYLQIHQYNQFNWSKAWWQSLKDLRQVSNKPVLIGEFGMQSAIVDPLGIHFHEGLWAGIFTGSAGTGMLWWWDTYIEPLNLYYHFKGISSFMSGERLQDGTMQPCFLKDTSQLQAFGLVSTERALIWVRSKKFNQRYFENAAWKVGAVKVEFPEVTGEVVIINRHPGRYRVETWDTIKGKIKKTEEMRLEEENLQLKIMKLKKDSAYKVYRISDY